MDAIEKIQEQVNSNPVIVYMKGSPQLPQCGFSSRAVQALQKCGQPFAYVNIFLDREVHRNLPRYSDWPTFPQLFIDGQLVGGCDIVLEMSESGELQTLIDEAIAKSREDKQ